MVSGGLEDRIEILNSVSRNCGEFYKIVFKIIKKYKLNFLSLDIT